MPIKYSYCNLIQSEEHSSHYFCQNDFKATLLQSNKWKIVYLPEKYHKKHKISHAAFSFYTIMYETKLKFQKVGIN